MMLYTLVLCCLVSTIAGGAFESVVAAPAPTPWRDTPCALVGHTGTDSFGFVSSPFFTDPPLSRGLSPCSKRYMCLWNCIDCHGGTVSLPVAHPYGPHRCICLPGRGGLDCRDCTSCLGGASCVKNTLITTGSRTFTCKATGTFGPILGPGSIVWSTFFDPFDETKPGTTQLTAYETTNSTPLLFQCDITDCTKSFSGNQQKILCEKTHCLASGFVSAEVNAFVGQVFGTTTFLMDATGSGSLRSQHLPFPLQFQCTATSCQFPGQNKIPMSTTERVLILVAAGLVLVVIVTTVTCLIVFSKRHKQHFIEFGESRAPCTLEWHNLRCTLEIRPPGGRKWKKLRVLRDVSGSALPGHVCAIVGESGAGKTSLLDTLAGRKTLGVIEGRILTNGHPKLAHWKRVAAYVMQDDVFVSTATVFEHLMFAARMRVPSVVNHYQRVALVEAVLERVGLEHVRHTVIGDHANKGLSGGERKRLNVASELLTSPEVIFLDEPTSGLDSSNALKVAQVLSELATRDNRTVVLSVHQPSSAVWDLFDSLVVMAKGRCVYQGAREGVLDFLASKGMHCPGHHNPADFLIECVTALQTDEQIIEFSQGGGDLDGWAGTSSSIQEAQSEGQSESLLQDAAVLRQAEKASEALGEYQQSFLNQTVYLMMRSLTHIWRNAYLLRLQYLTMIFVGAALSVVYYHVESTAPGGAQNRFGLMFFLAILLTMTSLASMDAFISDRKIFVRERSSGFYSAGAYFTAKVIADVFPLRILPPVILAAIVYPLVGLHQGADHVAYFMLILVLISFCATGLCMFISAFTPSVSVGNLIGILVMLFSMLFGGLLVNRGTIPPFLSWLRYLSFVNFGFEALMVNELLDLTLVYTPPPGQLGGPTPVTGYFYLQLFGLQPENFFLDIYLLLAFGILFFVGSFIALASVQEKR